jgi:hypothetical protein
VVGGFAGVPWPKDEPRWGEPHHSATDRGRKSFIFPLEPKAQPFDLLDAGRALTRWTGLDGNWRSFQFGEDLGIYDDEPVTANMMLMLADAVRVASPTRSMAHTSRVSSCGRCDGMCGAFSTGMRLFSWLRPVNPSVAKFQPEGPELVKSRREASVFMIGR